MSYRTYRSPAFLVLIAMLSACTTSARYRARLKEELKREILAELAREAPPGETNQAQVPAPGADPNPSLQSKTVEKGPGVPPAPGRTALALGGVSGRIVKFGAGVASCKVKLVRWVGMEDLSEVYEALQSGLEFETVTNGDGQYVFTQVPVGAYRLKWQPQGESGWLRRLSDRPEVWVEEGKVAAAKDIRMDRAPLPR